MSAEFDLPVYLVKDVWSETLGLGLIYQSRVVNECSLVLRSITTKCERREAVYTSCI